MGVAGPVRQVGFPYLAEFFPRGGGVGGFRARVAGGYGEADEVAGGAGVAVDDGFDEFPGAGRVYDFRGHYAVEPAEFPTKFGFGNPVEEDAVDHSVMKPDPDPHPRLGGIG